MVFWFFGFPGSGKDFCANKFSKILKAPYVNADDFLTEELKRKLVDGTYTIEDRIEKLEKICQYILNLLKQNSHVIATDSLPDNRSRQLILDTFKNQIKMILVTVSLEAHKKRLKKRQNHFFTADLLDKWVTKFWEPITFHHTILKNDKSGDQELIKKLKILAKKWTRPDSNGGPVACKATALAN